MSFINRIFAMLSGQRMINMITRSSDIVLAVFVVMLITIIIVPISPVLLDQFIAVNLAISITLLMVSLYIPKAVNLSIFPSLLLITTLFRLAIEISATKRILLYTNAGHIIYAFGDFVVGGNFVVGTIVFLIITIVQFIVVTKGAERVAEVAARFTLDAMPGKQMSIDADMRSGVLDANQARQLRLALQKESQLYGAMDGAMKFVKGDVIAGIVIAVVNIIGGLIIGMAMRGMTALQAAQIYTLLSIGGGLVAQIPSLLISMTAGIVTTRVSNDQKDSNLGREISAQILGQPKAVTLAGIVLLIMATFKGFPRVTFLLLGLAICGSGGYFWWKERKKQAAETAQGGVVDTGVDGHSVVHGGGDDYALTLPVILEMGKVLSQTIRRDKGGGNFIDEMIPKMRHALYQDLGIRFPGVHVRSDAKDLELDEYVIYLNEVPLIRGRLEKGKLLTSEHPETLKRYNIPYTESKARIGHACYWVDNVHEEVMRKAGIKFWRTAEVLLLHLSYFYQQYASEFLGIQEVRGILEFVERSYPDLVKEVTRLVPLQKLTEIFKRLVQEQVSIKDLRTILESLGEWAQTEKDTVLLTEYIRSSLKRYISFKYSQGQSVLAAYTLDPEIEDMVRGAIKQTSAGSYLALDPDTVQLILNAMRNMITPVPEGGQPPTLLVQMDVRRFVRKLVEAEYPDMPVISYQEIVPEMKVQPLGRIQLR